MQIVLFKCEAILNNRPLTYIYSTDLTLCLTPNHLLYGRVIQSSSIEFSPLTNTLSQLTAYMNKVNTAINAFCDKWRHEYLANLREAWVFSKFKEHSQMLLHQQKSTIHASKRCSISTFSQYAKVHVENGSS